MDKENNILKQISELLSSIFRHVIPGIIIIFLAMFYFPFAFSGFEPKEPYHIIFFGIMAIAFGNLMYAFHRFTWHQFLDIVYSLYYYSTFKRDTEKIFSKRFWSNFKEYFTWMSSHTIKYHKFEKENEKLFSLTHNKSAQIITLFITFEAIMIFDIFKGYLNECNNISLCYQNLFSIILWISRIGFIYCSIVCFIPWIMNIKFFIELEASSKNIHEHK